MTLDNKLASMMAALPAPSPATPADWERFVGAAHQSLRLRRFAVTALACALLGGAGVAYASLQSVTMPAPTSPAGGGDDEHAVPVEVWFVRDGNLAVTHRSSSAGVTVSEETGGATDLGKQMEDALQRLFAATSAELAREGLTTAIPEGTRLLSVELEPDGADAVAVVDVSGQFLTADDRELATAQVVFTATQLSGVKDVRILVEGQAIEMTGDDRGEFDDRLSPLIVAVRAAEGRREHYMFDPTPVSGSVAWSGGRLTYELVDSAGELIATGTFEVPSGHTEDGEKVRCRQEDDCRLPYEGDITFTVTQETPGVLRLFVLKGDERLYETTIPVVLAPDRS